MGRRARNGTGVTGCGEMMSWMLAWIIGTGSDPGRRVSAVILSSEEGEIREGRMKQPGQKGVGWARMMVVGGLGGVHDGR